MSKAVRIIVALVLVACIAYSTYMVLEISGEYDKADAFKAEMLVFHPEPLPSPTPEPPIPATAPPKISRPNQSIVDAQNDINPDIVGWITIPGTVIDYLFVHSADNADYLKRDLRGSPASAGSIFMDFRNSRDFSDFNSILYGHHMKNGSMFHDLRRFGDEDVFKAIQTGTIYLADRTYAIRIFAYLVIDANDTAIYQTLYMADQDGVDTYLGYVKQHARRFREPDLSFGDQVVTLSTCAYEFEGARMVLLAKLEEEYM